MKKIILFVLVVFLANVVKAQDLEWAKQLTTAEGASIAVDVNGNVYTCGEFALTTDFDPGPGVYNLTTGIVPKIFISKVDASGNFVWAKQFVGDSWQDCNAITVDTLGNVYTTGYFDGLIDFDPGAGTAYFNSVGSEDIFVSKLDSAGNFIWAKQFGGSGCSGKSLTVDALGNVYTVGSFQSTVDFNPGTGVFNLSSFGNRDIFISKLDASGNFVWAKQFGGTGNDYIQSISLDALGNIYTTGYFNGTADFNPNAGINNLISFGNEDIFVSKLNSSGNFIWVKQFGGTNNDVGTSIKIDALGNVYTTGYFDNTVDFDPNASTYNLTSIGNLDMFISKLDASGNFVWAKQIAGVGNVIPLSLDIDAYGALYTTGFFIGTADFDPGNGTFNLSTVTIGNSEDIFISKLDAAGNFIWAQQFGGIDDDLGKSIKLDAFGNIHTTGSFRLTVDFDPSPNALNLTSTNSQNMFIHKMSQCMPTFGIDIVTTCNNFTWINGVTYTSSNNNALDTIVNVSGCDSIVALNLTINNATDSIISQTSCNTYTFNNQTLTSSGMYYDTLVNATGCDSIITLNLTIFNSTSSTQNQSACSSYTFNNQTLTQSGTYYDTLQNANGCDSIITLNLTINPTTSSTLNQTACDTYTFNNQTLTQSGIYYDTLINSSGCDSIITLNLTINNVPTTITQSGATLTANATGVSYQWYQCNPTTLIAGATSQTYTATTNGDYSVVLTQNGCSDTAFCVTVTGVSVKEYLQNNISISPNPSTGVVRISSTENLQNAYIKVLGLTGQIILQKEQISGKNVDLDLSSFANGIYFIEIKTGNETYREKVVKE